MTDTAVPTTFCSYHHRTPATAACCECGKAVCDICRQTVNAAVLCTGCGVGRVTQKPWLAALFSFVLPGCGQAYNGDWVKAAVIFVLAPVVVPWLWGVIDAPISARAIATGRRPASAVPTGGVLLGLKILWVPVAAGYALLLALAASAFLSGMAAAFR